MDDISREMETLKKNQNKMLRKKRKKHYNRNGEYIW